MKPQLDEMPPEKREMFLKADPETMAEAHRLLDVDRRSVPGWDAIAPFRRPAGWWLR